MTTPKSGRSRAFIRRSLAVLSAAALSIGAAAMTVTPASAATVTVLNDSFDTASSTGVPAAPTGGSYSIVPAAAAGLVSVSGGALTITGLQSERAAGVVATSTSATDAVVSGAFVAPSLSGTSATWYGGLEARRQADGSTYRGKIRYGADGRIGLGFSRTAGSTETLLSSTTTVSSLSAGTTFSVDFRVTGSNPVTLQARLWAAGQSKPDWQTQVVDSSASRLSGAGAVGAWNYLSNASAPTTVRMNSLSAVDESGTTTVSSGSTTGSTTTTTGGKPNASTTGVRSGTSLSRYTGPLNITTPGTVIENKAIYGDLRIQARDVVIRNSYLHCGTGHPSSNTGCVDANHWNVYNLLVENNTIIPDSPSYFRDGIVGHEFTARGNHISRTNDGIGIFNRPGGAWQANVRVTGNYIHDLTHWNYDPAHANGTHNDGIEIQGGQNIYIAGNNIVGSVVAGDGLGQYGLHGGAALLVTQNVTQVNNLVIEKNWFDDAQNSVNIQPGKFSTVTLTLQYNWFGRNQYDFGRGSKYAIRIVSQSRSTVYGLLTNRWEDTNGLMTVGRDTGIRYDS
ncbi:hypothetical protein FDO65_09180 [Nakamurella flava]|uniref:Right-handed parallel beta-helix repeat-containing protein n=1 Tax=Nakamurella flava TaxID=2576308 RepID=A0A4U6QM71_9ACTN|nr:hypothetical protein [Nakamurella flava]TKV61704.1 hypothetical protein FDO65_09180 [Nakamurella flava]